MLLLLIRHGTSTKNLEDRHGVADPMQKWELTEHGIKDTLIASAKLRCLVGIDAVFSSSVNECIQTAHLLFGQELIPILQLDSLTSIDFGIVSGLSKAEIHSRFPEIGRQLDLYEKGILHPKDYTIGNAESNAHFERRIRASLSEILGSGHSTVCIVAHRSTFTMILNIVSNWPNPTDAGHYESITFDPLGISLLDFGPRSPHGTVLAINCSLNDPDFER